MSDFSNKVACITGAAGGMGRAVATELAKRPCRFDSLRLAGV